MGAGDDLDERRFARSVFAEKRVHFAAVQSEGDTSQRANSLEGFRDVAQFEEGWFHHQEDGGRGERRLKSSC